MASTFRDLYPENRDNSGRLLEIGKKVEALEFATTGVKVLALQQLIGPYPQTISFFVERDQSNILILTSATIFPTGAVFPILAWINVTVDGSATGGVDTPGMLFNEFEHHTVPMAMTLIPLAYGNHVYQIEHGGGGLSNSDDRAEVLIMKLP